MKNFFSFISILFFTFCVFAGEKSDDKPKLAVMDIEDKTGKFHDSIAGATEYLRNAMIRSNKFFVVAESRQRAKMQELKEASYQGCYDEKCQIKLGKELAADTILVTTINSLTNNHYEMVSTLIDLEKVVHTKSALVTFGEKESLLSALKGISDQISGRKISVSEKLDRYWANRRERTDDYLRNSYFYGEYDRSVRDPGNIAFWTAMLGMLPTMVVGPLCLGLGFTGSDPDSSLIIPGAIVTAGFVAAGTTVATYAVWDKYTKGERAAGLMISFGALAAAGGGVMAGMSDGNKSLLGGGIAATLVGAGMLAGGITMAVLDARARELKGTRPRTSFFVSPTKGGAYAQLGVNF